MGFALAPLGSGLLQMLVMGRAGAFSIIVLSYPIALLFGVPAFFSARYLKWLGLKAVLFGGAGLGVLVGLVLAMDGLQERIVPVIVGVSLLALHGAIVAGLFWFIALWRANRSHAT